MSQAENSTLLVILENLIQGIEIVLDVGFLPLVPGCVMIQSGGSACVALNINMLI